MTGMLISNARILTVATGDGSTLPRRGRAMRELHAVDRGSVRIRDGRIAEVAEGALRPSEGELHIDAEGRVLLPAWVDCHTHSCWAGNRLDEFEARNAGAEYLEILRRGGGIMSTVRATRAADDATLVANLLRRLRRMARLGTGTVEVKSGYGLDTSTELRMLRAVRAAAAHTPQRLVPTFLGAHAIDHEQPNFVERTINETLPAVVDEFPGIACDAFCEEAAWSLADVRRLFENAHDLGCRLRVHTDQFHSLGMTRLAVEMGAISVDHLEALNTADLPHLAHGSTIAVLLPVSGFHLDGRYGPAREIIDAGGAVALATNCNPGSAPTPSMPFVAALATRKLHMTTEEAIVATTFNAACVLEVQEDVGSIEVGKRADLQLLDTVEERDLGFEIASAGPLLTIINGTIAADGRNGER